MIELALPVDEMALTAGATYYLTDLFSGESRPTQVRERNRVEAEMPGHSTRLWILAEEAVKVPTAAVVQEQALPDKLSLAQGYPNPFRTTATVVFETPQPGSVQLVLYDMLGRRIATLVDAYRPAGHHEAIIDGRGLPSGAYFYQLVHRRRIRTGVITLLR